MLNVNLLLKACQRIYSTSSQAATLEDLIVMKVIIQVWMEMRVRFFKRIDINQLQRRKIACYENIDNRI